MVIGISTVAGGALCLSALLHAAPPSTGRETVVDAAMRGNRDEVRTLLKSGEDVNTAQGDGMTALHWAVQKGDLDLAKLLLYAGANVRATTRIGGYTPLLVASKNGNAAMVEALLANGADPKATTAAGATPLMLASRSGSVDAVKQLLAHGAEVDVTEPVKGESALTVAAAMGRADVVRVLAASGANVAHTTKVIDLEEFNKEEQKRLAEIYALQGGGGGGNQGGRGGRGGANQPAQAAAGGRRGFDPNAKPGVDRQYNYTELVGHWGGLAPLHLAARQGELETVRALVDAHADINQRSAGDQATAMVVATVNGNFDVAKYLLDHGADPNLAQDNGVTPLYAAVNCQWADKALYPQPRAQEQQHTTYLDLMQALLEKGANANARLLRKVWYGQYDFDQSGVDEAGATAFWRASYADDVDAMKLLVKYGSDYNIPTERTPGRPRLGDASERTSLQDVSGLPPVPVGGPGVPALLAASGQGYGEGLAANHHHYSPGGMLPAVKYLVEELHVDVNARDHEGNTALHNAAARGDNEMIKYLVSKGADPKAVNRSGVTTVDMANGPVQRITPFPDTIKLLEDMGAKNNHHCVTC
jgi:ankyrin repeat protein